MASKIKNTVKIIFFLLAATFLLIDPAISAEQGFYSIHLSTFRNLGDVNTQVNSLKEKGETVFYKKSEIPDMGQFYMVYFGRYQKWNDAVANMDKLKIAGAESPLGIKWFIKTIESKKLQDSFKLDHPEQIVSKKSAFVQSSYSVPDKDRFVDNMDGTVTDTKTNLMWIKNGWPGGFISAVPWIEAMNKVNNFRHGNFSDWRLPTIEEWNSLIDANNQNPALIEPNPFKNLNSHIPYWSKTEYAYDLNHIRNDQGAFHSYVVTLWSGTIHHLRKNENALVLPVRSIVIQKLSRK